MQKFDTCTKQLGPLRQDLFACITCNPPPANPFDPYTPAGVCYSCSVACHGEHTLVELFYKRNFVCDCGSTRLPSTAPCTLRINSETGQKGGVVGEPCEEKNEYNQNFRNRFCGCECDYDANSQKGTMYQCLGLGTARNGGCGEDWYHTTCVVGLDPSWHDEAMKKKAASTGPTTAPAEENGNASDVDDDMPTPPGFPDSEDFAGFICYKCVEANPWIKAYAGTDGFLPPVFKRSAAPSPQAKPTNVKDENEAVNTIIAPVASTQKRKAEDDDIGSGVEAKRAKSESDVENKLTSTVKTEENSVGEATTKPNTNGKATCKAAHLPAPPNEPFSLFFKDNFRDNFCRCPACFPHLATYSQLLDEEESYEQSVSNGSSDGGAHSTLGSGGSLLDRGERALSAMDRVKAIEGVMAFNHLKEKLTPFFKEFADSGRVISAEDIKAHFAKMRGDDSGVQKAGEAGEATGGEEDRRREQGGY
jgi:E3 ubiquitin-protein ligase UBR7